MTRLVRLVALCAAAVLVLASTGCKPEVAEKPQPKVSPPAIKTAGTLVVGVDLSTPPFAGVDQGKKAGIDVDIAAAMADELGVAVAYKDVKPSDAATALAQGDVDVVLSVPFTGSGSTQVLLAGTYITDAPVFFVATEGTASIEPSMTLDNLRAEKVAAQKGSEAYWILLDELGEGAVEGYATEREAIEALDSGLVPLVAGDALVGAYIVRDFPAVKIAGQVGPGSPLAAAVAADNTALADSIRGALDKLAADGILDFVAEKWVGSVPEFSVETSAATATPAP